MVLVPHIVLALCVTVSGVLLLYAANAYYLVFSCLGARRRLGDRNARDYREGMKSLGTAKDWPLVTTQVPLFNEIAVAERVINAVAVMDYPAGRHGIQILDDSTDETSALVEAVAGNLRAHGVQIEVIRRTNRHGYKAGALAEGMQQCRGELIAIFDADFVPPADFLRRTVPCLVARPGAGWVQARWGHLNEDGSCLTRAQGIGIDGHFAIDQIARCGTSDVFMNFNGTGGVWRKAAIEDAGGWTADTLTEDLDLSYRAQMRGWQGIYLPELVVPGELPADAAAFKSQQFRWAKGSVQTAIKLIPSLFRSDAPLVTKIQGWFQLTHYAIHPFILMLAILSLPMALLLPSGWKGWGWTNILIVTLSLAPSVFYATGQYLLHESWPVRLLRLPFLILAGIGLALSNSIAVYEAVSGKRSPFHRTPKQGQSGHRLYRAQVSVPLWGELAVGLASLAAFLLACTHGRGMEAQFLLLTGASFLCFFGYSALGRRASRKSAPELSLPSLERP